MMTPQEVSATTFAKATLGGYNMAAVDVFLDILTEDYTTLYKENAALKAKIKVLVDKMEEYHAMEDTMRSTLLTAQKMANSMIHEAEEKRAALLDAAEADARVRMRELSADIAAEERRLTAAHEEVDRKIAQEQERLVVAQRELAAFINGAKALCSRQMDLLGRLSEMDILPAGFMVPDAAAQNTAQDEAPAQAGETAAPQARSANAAGEASAQAPAAPADEQTAAAMAEVVDQLGGDANSLMESMRSVIDSFAAEGEVSADVALETPFEIDFDDASKLFDDGETNQKGDPFADSEDENYDDFDGEEKDSTRVLNLDDLQFGRNYNKK